MDKAFIKISGLTKKFDNNTIVKDFNFTIEQGEFLAITGASGCGKTTLLNMIGGLEPVTGGNIIVDGLDITKQKNLQKYYRDIVGFVFQNFALIEHKTVEENLAMIHKKGKSLVGIDEALKSVGMEKSRKQKIYQLSGGEQQRIALARLKMKNCTLILADEPTGSLDKNNAKMVMEMLKSLKQEGKTIILVTHDLECAKSEYITKSLTL